MVTLFIVVFVVLIIAIVLAALADCNTETYAVITVVAFFIFVAGAQVITGVERPAEEIEKFKSKCFVENGGIAWNVSAAIIDLEIHGISFTFQVSDFKGKEKIDDKEVLYTPETLKHCFSQGR